MSTIGFVGPGQMGMPMVERLVTAGHSVVVHARREEVREHLDELGARAVADPREVADGADLVLICLFSDPQLQEVAPSLIDAARKGSIIASHVTGSIATIQELAERGRSRGIDVLDAPVSGTDTKIRAGELTVMLGGDSDAVAAATGPISAYSNPVLPTGPLGSALKMKLVNNLLFAANVQLVAEAAALGESLGLETSTLLTTLGHCSGGSAASSYASAAGDIATFGAGIAHYLGKDVAVCQQVAAELGANPELLLSVVDRGPLPLTS
ncbi:NAD(P)-dependent oxidoreductase [Aeromicrobium yanjiei]|nr:NAD(P)-dependent oxidoreductase [Aeromicrobium yanjiei]